MKKIVAPVIRNGEYELVVQDAKSYHDVLEAIEGIKRGLED